ncbi:MAG: hypothetical protein IPI73_24715 [Betaproteobacteria bacterium]|nr:hypothetical protein [Betaproteobacteria bacterium]
MEKGGFEGVYVVGAGQTQYEKRTEKTVPCLVWEASDRALKSAGLSWSAIDGLGITSFSLLPENVTTMTEHLGIQCRWVVQGTSGGASCIAQILQAARAIQNGDVGVAVIAAADAFDVSTHMSMSRNPRPT